MSKQLGGQTEIFDQTGTTVVVSTDIDSSNYRRYDHSLVFDVPTTMPVAQIMTQVNDCNKAVSTSVWGAAEALKQSVSLTPYLTDDERNDSHNLTAGIINGLHEMVTMNAQLEARDNFAMNNVDAETIKNLDHFIDATRENKKRLAYRDVNGKDFLLSLIDSIAILRRLFVPEGRFSSDDVFNRIYGIYDTLGADMNSNVIIDEVNVLTAVFGNSSVNPVSYVTALGRSQLINEATSYCVTKGRDFNQAVSEADYVLHSVGTALQKALSREEHRGNIELMYFVDDVEKDYLQDAKNASIINDDNYKLYRRHAYRTGYDTRGGIFNDILQEYTDMGLHDGSMILPDVVYNPNREIVVNDPKKPGVGPASTLSNGQLVYSDQKGGTKVVGRKSIWGAAGEATKAALELVNNGNNNNNGGLFGNNSKQNMNNNNTMNNNNYNNNNFDNNGYNPNMMNNGGNNYAPYNNNAVSGPQMNNNMYGQNNYGQSSNYGQSVGSGSPLNNNNGYNNYNTNYGPTAMRGQQPVVYSQQNTVKSAFDAFKEKYTGGTTVNSNNSYNSYNTTPMNNNYSQATMPMRQMATSPTANYSNMAMTSPNPVNYDGKFVNVESAVFGDGRRQYFYRNGYLYRQYHIDNMWYPVIDNPNAENRHMVHFEGDRLVKGDMVINDGALFDTVSVISGVGEVGGNNATNGKPVLFGV